MQTILLCADSDSLAHSELLGLDDVNLDAVPWLKCFSCAAELRRQLKAGLKADEAWIASSDDVEAINLLAALRKDDPNMTLLLVVQKATGSILSRAQNAGANGTLTAKGFIERFALENFRRARMEEAALVDDEILLEDISQADIDKAKGISGAEDTAGSADKTAPIKTTALATEIGAAAFEMRAERGSGQAFVLTVFSGSGGAGKSTVSAISAALAADRGYRTLLMDCDMQFGDIHRLVGEGEPLTLDDILEDPGKLDSLAIGDNGDGCCGLHLLAAPKRLEQSEVIGQYLPKILDAVSGLFDVIVVNTGANWADYHAVLLERSECSLLLVDQRTSSVRACQHALELCSRLGVASGSFAYAVNHCERGALFTSLDVAFAMQGAHVYELKEGGSVVEEMLGAGRLQDLLSSKNNFCESVGSMLDEILPERQSKDKRRKRVGLRKKALDGRLVDSEQRNAGPRDTTARPNASAASMSGASRKHSPRRRGRASRIDDLPAIGEDMQTLVSGQGGKAPESWR